MVKCISAEVIPSEQREMYSLFSSVHNDSYKESLCVALLNFKSTKTV